MQNNNSGYSIEQLKQIAGPPSSPSNSSGYSIEKLKQIAGPPDAHADQMGQYFEPAMGKDSFLDKAGSYAGAFNKGFEAIPDKLSYNIDSTINSLAKGLGLVSSQEHSARQKYYDERLSQSIDQNDPDVKAHPTTANLTRDLGALGTEIGAGMGAASLVGKGLAAAMPGAAASLAGPGFLPAAGRVALGTLSDIGQGAAVYALESKDNKGEAALFGGGIAGAIGLPLRIAGEVVSSIVRGGKSTAEVADTVRANSNLERSMMGTNEASLGQVTGNPTVQGFEQRARNTLLAGTDGPFQRSNEAVQDYINRTLGANYGMKAVKPESLYDDAAKLSSAVRNTTKGLKQQADDLYTNAVRNLDSVNEGGIEAVGTKSTLQELKNNLSSIDVRSLGNGDVKTLQDTLSKAEMVTSRPSSAKDIYTIAQRIGEDINRYVKNPSGSSKTVVDQLKAVRNSLMDDLEAASVKSGLPNEFNSAKNFYRDVYKPLDDLPMDSGNSFQKMNKLADYLADADNAHRSSVLNSLGPEVQKDFKTFLINKALDSKSSFYNNGMLNSKNFAHNYADIVKKNNLVFSKEDQQIAEGVSKISELLATGRNAPNNAGSAIGQTAWVRFFTTNALGRNIILNASKLPPDSPKMQSIVNSINNISEGLRRTIPVAGAEALTPSPTNPQDNGTQQ